MSWQGIEGHDRIADRFRRAVSRGRIGGTYLFVGPPGIGKKAFALKLAQTLLCERHRPDEFIACNTCSACLQVLSGTHPDLLVISKPADRAFIPLELLVGDREQRATERGGLIGHLALTPYYGRYRVAIIDDADYFNLEGANALLKTLEEPPPSAILILIGTSPAKQLPTIRSRSQMVRFRPLPEETAASLLVQLGVVNDFHWARQLVRLAGGSLAQAQELASPELWEIFGQWKGALSQRAFDVLVWSERIREFLESLGKEAAVRRRALQQFIGLTVEFFRQACWQVAKVQNPSECGVESAALDSEVRTLVGGTSPLGEEALQECLEECLAAYELVERNVNQVILIDDWLLRLWHTLNRV